MRLIAAVLGLVLAGCSYEHPDTLILEVHDSDLRRVVTIAAAAWTSCGGPSVAVGERGVPVRWGGPWDHADGVTAFRSEPWAKGEPLWVEIERNHPDALTIVSHEIGRALGLPIAPAGLMAPQPDRDLPGDIECAAVRAR